MIKTDVPEVRHRFQSFESGISEHDAQPNKRRLNDNDQN